MVDNVLNTAITVVVSGVLGFCINALKNYMKRDKVYGEALKCLLRANMTNTYFLYKNTKKIPLYCKQSWNEMYKAYKDLGGNSFIEDIKEKIDDLDISNEN